MTGGSARGQPRIGEMIGRLRALRGAPDAGGGWRGEGRKRNAGGEEKPGNDAGC